MMERRTFDRPFLIIVLILAVAGFIFFFFTSLGLSLTNEPTVSTIIFKQSFFGTIGILLAYFAYKINYRILKRYAFLIFLGTLFLTALVFFPGLGIEHAGAKRWLSVGTYSFQPSELLKLGYVIYFAGWLSSIKSDIRTIKFGILPMGIVLAVVGAILLAQPHTGAFLVISLASLSMFIVAGGRLRHLAIFFLIGVLLLTLLAFTRPYIKDRLITYVNPSQLNPLKEGYQITQSLIAIGSGGIIGGGLGQSVQKFNYLPEPVGDSIFAVVGEELGFIGSSILVLLYTAFAILGLRIASRAPDVFSRLLVVGIVILISAQSFSNIGAMLALLPISGVPLLFVSQGGTALIYTFVSVGIVLNISKHQLKV